MIFFCFQFIGGGFIVLGQSLESRVMAVAARYVMADFCLVGVGGGLTCHWSHGYWQRL